MGSGKAWGMLAPEVGVRDAFCRHWAAIEGLCAEGRYIQTRFRKILLEAVVTTVPVSGALRL